MKFYSKISKSLIRKRLTRFGLLAGGMVSLAACSMINEDLNPCAPKPNTLIVVDFVYDYNMFETDLFDRHAGTVHLYVFDKDSIFLFDRSKSINEMPGSTVDFSMYFDTTELIPGKKYLLVAMAQGNHSGYEWSTVVTPGFQIPLENQMIPGVSKISDYRIKLDRDDDTYADLGVVDYRDAYGNNTELLDTLWSTKPGEIQSLSVPYIEYTPSVVQLPDTIIRKEVPMMRITNAIKVNLIQESVGTTVDENTYNILIHFPKGNGTIGMTGHVYSIQELYYRALRKSVEAHKDHENGDHYEWDAFGVTKADGDSQGKQYNSIQATFGVSRLQVTDNSSLQIRDGVTNEIIAEITDFSKWLAEYFEKPYDDQEFLDREYDYTIDVHLSDDGSILYYQIGCAILGWGKRVYNYDLS